MFITGVQTIMIEFHRWNRTTRSPAIVRNRSIGGLDALRAMAATKWRAASVAAVLLLTVAFEASAQSSTSPQARPRALQTIAVLDFDLIDDQHDTVPDTTLAPRLASIRQQLAEALTREGLYTVVDNAPAGELMQRLHNTQDLHACNGCELEIGRALHADRVLVGWVQKVSNLILNINIQIEDVATGQVILNKSVDLRGNTDTSWRRGIAYLIRDMVEKHQGSR